VPGRTGRRQGLTEWPSGGCKPIKAKVSWSGSLMTKV
jgi:hypothetical protein